jgi:hypothetical protein
MPHLISIVNQGTLDYRLNWSWFAVAAAGAFFENFWRSNAFFSLPSLNVTKKSQNNFRLRIQGNDIPFSSVVYSLPIGPLSQ